MPNIKSAKKRVEISNASTLRNKAARSVLKTTIKKFNAAAGGGDRQELDAAYKAAVRKIDQSVKKGVLHRNTAARKKSSIALKYNSIA